MRTCPNLIVSCGTTQYTRLKTVCQLKNKNFFKKIYQSYDFFWPFSLYIYKKQKNANIHHFCGIFTVFRAYAPVFEEKTAQNAPKM